MDVNKLKALMAQKKQSMKRVDRAAGFGPGKTRIRIAPGWRKGEEEIWFHDYGQHFIKNAADEIQAVYLCADATFGTPCKVCDAVRTALKHSHDDTTNEVVAKSLAGKSILINAFHLDSDEPNTPKVTAVKPTLFTKLMTILEENGPEAFFDPTEGHEIVVTREGKAKLTKYDASMVIKKGTPIPASAYKNLNDLDDYVKQESDEQERKAIAAVNTVAGFLPAPGSVPSTTSGSLGLAAPAAAPIGAMRTSPGSKPAPEFEDVPDFETADVALDAELDDLLGDDPTA